MTDPVTEESADQNLYRSVGQQIRKRRRELGLTQQNLAEASGVRFQQIQKYEMGDNRIPLERLLLIANKLEKPVGYFLSGVESETEMQLLEQFNAIESELVGNFRALPPQVQQHIASLVKEFKPA